MRKSWFKYLLFACLLITYINRGLFVLAPDTEPAASFEAGKGEINSMIELLHWMFSGYENGVDEDGNSPESYNYAKLAHSFSEDYLMQSVELLQPVTLIRPSLFPRTEVLLPQPAYGTIDHPPEEV